MSQPNVVRNRNSFITPSNAHPLRVLEFNNLQSSDALKYFENGK
jgi:hypothetical protein